MNNDHEAPMQRIEVCREIYLKFGGEHHEVIEQEMREIGYADFHRRCLYRRFERGTCKEGWIGKYGWERLLSEPPASAGGQNVELATTNWPPAHAGGSDPLRPHSENPHSAFGTPHLEDFTEFQNWLKQVSPSMGWEWKHQVYIYKRLKRVSDGLCNRLMIFLPPRHGKSELVTVRYAAWRLKQDPKLNIILGSYNQRLANRFSRKIRRVLMDDAFLDTAPDERAEKVEADPKTVKTESSTSRKDSPSSQ